MTTDEPEKTIRRRKVIVPDWLRRAHRKVILQAEERRQMESRVKRFLKLR